MKSYRLKSNFALELREESKLISLGIPSVLVFLKNKNLDIVTQV